MRQLFALVAILCLSSLASAQCANGSCAAAPGQTIYYQGGYYVVQGQAVGQNVSVPSCATGAASADRSCAAQSTSCAAASGQTRSRKGLFGRLRR